MTIEEAGEIVLGGRILMRCANCEGSGRATPSSPTYGKRHYWSSPTIATGRRAGSTETCLECQGAGTVTEARYREACELLGIVIR